MVSPTRFHTGPTLLHVPDQISHINDIPPRLFYTKYVILMIDYWDILVFRYVSEERNCIEIWLDEVQRLESLKVRINLEAFVDARLDTIKKTKNPEELDWLFFPLEDRGDLCDGVDAIKFASNNMHRRILGIREHRKSEFAIFLADTKDVVGGPDNNPDFYEDACEEVSIRCDLIQEGSGVLGEY